MATNNQRREAAKRQLEAQLAQRQRAQTAQRGRMLYLAIGGSVLVVILAVVLLAVFNGGGKSSNTAAGSASGSTAPTSAAQSGAAQTTASRAPGTCDFTKDTTGTAAKTVELPPTTGVADTGTATVTFTTSQGVIVMTVDRAKAPCTVESFLSLVGQKYYDNTTCHRLVTSGIYVLQCGDPTASGSGGPGYTIPDEGSNSNTYPAGTVAMARTQQAHSGGSQFFFVYQDSPSLAQNLGALQYTPFGTVTQGLDVLTKIAAGGTDNSNGSDDGKPKTPVTITNVTIA